MTREEMIRQAEVIRQRDRFGSVSAEELAALPGTEQELYIDIGGGRKVHVYEERPDSLPDQAALILNFHGGGFIKGRTDRDRRYCCYLMQQLNCLVWDIDYCTAPEHPFPAAVEESYGIAVYAYSHAEELGIDRSRIAMAGHSAGGNLVAAACIKNAEQQEFSPCALLMEYFPADNTVNPIERLPPELQKNEFWVKRAQTEKLYTDFYVGTADPADPLCSPLKASSEVLGSFSPSLVISAGEDSLMEDTERFGHKLAAAGVTVTATRISEAMRGFTVNRTPGWEKALQLHCSFLKPYLA